MSIQNTRSKIFIDLIPNHGLQDITFGMLRVDVRKKMKELYAVDGFTLRGQATECFLENSLQFSYEDDDTLTFIETAAPPPVFVSLLGIRTWEIPGDELLRRICEEDAIDMDISNHLNPIFQRTHITLYNLSADHDYIGGQMIPKWDAIGIGDDRYYKRVRAIYGKK